MEFLNFMYILPAACIVFAGLSLVEQGFHLADGVTQHGNALLGWRAMVT